MQHAISAGHETTLAVAKEILRDKGNAFDAAIAAHFAMFITEPCMASAGGNGFALAREANGKIQFFDFFCQTPVQKYLEEADFYPIVIDFGGESETFHVGMGAAAVPGSIAGVFEMHHRYGSIPMKELVAPAQDLAKSGVPINTFQAFDLKLLEPIYKQDPNVRSIFFKEDRTLKEGELLRMPGTADFLDFIVEEGVRGFYQGDIARMIAADSKAKGGSLRRVDFENYQVKVLDPLKINYKNKNIFLPNGPSKGGAAMAFMLANTTHQTASLATAIQTAQQLMQSENQIKQQMDSLYPNNNFQLQPAAASHKGTSHFNIVDRDGNAVSLTSSIGEGCGYFIPGTELQLNNMMGEVFLLPNGPHSWTPNTRMHSMMTPTMVCDQSGALELVAGTGGASRIPYAIGQVIYQIYENNKTLNESIEAPRYHFQDGLFQVEHQADWPYENENAAFWKEKAMYFGGVHAIQKKSDGIEAIGDARRYGVGEVF